MRLRILHTNDMHGALTPERAGKLGEIREGFDLYFDSGDAIKTGNLGIPMREEPVWRELNRLRCTASVLGNRETHVLESAFRAKMAGAGHPLLCANLERRNGGNPLPGTLEFECRGVKVGVVAVMVPMVTRRMKTQLASAFLWEPPIAVAATKGYELRSRVDLLIALTHIGHRQDQELAAQAPYFDVILGGHSHTVLERPDNVGRVAICQGGSHCRYIGAYQWSADAGFTGGLQPFPS